MRLIQSGFVIEFLLIERVNIYASDRILSYPVVSFPFGTFKNINSTSVEN
jgi:hypothetical protein